MASARALKLGKKCAYLLVTLGLFAFAVLCGAPRAAADDSGNGWEYCYANFPGVIGHVENQPTYFTAVFAFHNGSAYGNMFSQYVEKKYSLRTSGPAGCSYSGVQGGVEASLKQRLTQLKAAGHPVVETDWTKDKHEALMAELKANPPPVPAAPPAPRTTPSAPAPNAQDAYQKALAARRPASNTTAPLNAAGAVASGTSAANTANLPAPSEKYSYCYATGIPLGRTSGPVHPSYYVSTIFPWRDRLHPEDSFQKMLRARHPQETIGRVWCTNGGSMSAMATARRNGMGTRRSNGFNVNEVNWSPDM